MAQKTTWILASGAAAVGVGVVAMVMAGMQGAPEPEPAAPPAAVMPAAPSTRPAGATAAVPAPEPAVAEAEMEAPAFDVVRVSPEGSALVAGRAAPGASVVLRVDGVAVAQTAADAEGNFVALFSLPPSGVAQILTLEAQDAAGASRAAEETVVLTARAAPEAPAAAEAPASGAPDPQAPLAATLPAPGGDSEDRPAPVDLAAAEPPAPPAAFLLRDDGAVERLGAAPAAANVVIDTIAYSGAGEVQIAGRASSIETGANLRIYLDNRPIAVTRAEAGDWTSDLPAIDPGVYTLRVDQLDDEGRVVSRFETPFQREEPALVAAAQTPTADEAAPPPPVALITVQPGHTLWAISRARYGMGEHYVVIYNANRSQIRDPDLIYPGQVFSLPDE